jgi:(p)ppGpp synthase/HD superfamily hydrolase
MNVVIRAVRFATRAHHGQTRKYNPVPYITHPVRVMARTMLLEGVTEDLCVAAVLHDVLEDCGITAAELEREFGPAVAKLVGELTNVSKLEHPEANRAERKRLDRERIRTISTEAKKIKLIDRIDNLREIPPTEGFLQKYRAESRLLLEVLRGVDAELEAELEGMLTE